MTLQTHTIKKHMNTKGIKSMFNKSGDMLDPVFPSLKV